VVFFQDEARFGRISRETACWVKKDVVPAVAKQLIRDYIYAYSALSPQTGDCFSIISPVCNTEAMNVFLNMMSKEYTDYRMVILLDKAGWHTSSMLTIPENIKLMHLTPYSPELNPVELLWREVRAKYFHNRFFNSLDDVELTLCQALNHFNENQDLTKSLSKGYDYFNKIDGG
jgi:putative transposase